MLPGQLLRWYVGSTLGNKHLRLLLLQKGCSRGCTSGVFDQELPLLIDEACRSQLLNQLMLLVVVGPWLEQDRLWLLMLNEDVLGGDGGCLLG